MIEAVITASVLILAVIAVRFLFRTRISRRLQYGLWALVLIRLLIPVSLFASDISVMNAVSMPQASNQQVYIGKLSETPVSETEGVTANDNSGLNDANSFGYSVLSEDGKTVTRYAEKTSVSDILKLVWLVGGIAIGLWFVIANFVFYMRLRKSRVPYIGEHGLPLEVYVVEGLASPCLFGPLRPAVYLTPAAVAESAFPYVCAHEYCHYHHFDHIWALFRGVCLAMYWWNPLVWAAAILSRRDSETACDEAAIKLMGEENRLIYGKTLVDMIAVKPSSGIMCSATTMSGGKHAIKERLNLIISNRKTIIPAAIAALLIIGIAAACAFTGAKTENLYERFGMKLAIPGEYEGIVDFTPADELSYNSYIIAWHTPSRGLGDNSLSGWMFSIVRHPLHGFVDYGTEMEGIDVAKPFAADDKYVYIISSPKDTQIASEYWKTDENGVTDNNLSYLVNQNALISDFIERNGLKPFPAASTSKSSDAQPPDNSPSTEGSDDNAAAKTYRLGGYPLKSKTADDDSEIYYLTSITLRNNSAMVSYICSSNDTPLPTAIPDIIAVAADKKEYTLKCVLWDRGYFNYECKDIPYSEIDSLKILGVDVPIKPASFYAPSEDVLNRRLSDLPNMSFAELFAYCEGSDGAFSDGVYSEMAKRFVKNPEEFAAHFMMPAYPFANDYKKTLSSINMNYTATQGFDEATNESICYNVLYECLYELSPDELNAVIKTLSNSDYEIVRKAAEIFADVAAELK